VTTVTATIPSALQIYTPPPPLGDFVAAIWHWEGDPGPHRYDRLLPTGAASLIVNLQEDRIRDYDPQDLQLCESFPGAVVVGTYSQATVIDTDEQRAVLGVNFRPGGAFPFLGIPAGELQNGQASLEVLWGSRGRRLRELLLEAPTVAGRFAIVEQALRAQITRPLARHPAVAFALRGFESVTAPTVGEVTRQTGLSRRRFIEVFRDQVGLAPKVYWRLQRFRHVLQRVHRAPPCRLGRSRSGVRLLRPGSPHPRLSRVLRTESVGLPSPARRAPESRPAVGLAGPGQIRPIRRP
jgi:AraC-like DNA-binding protein